MHTQNLRRTITQAVKAFCKEAGAMITSYARYFTITAAQENYESFIYADTDSLHLIGKDAGKNLPVTYKGKRKAGGIIQPDEVEYILNDVLVLKETLEFMIDAGQSNKGVKRCTSKI